LPVGVSPFFGGGRRRKPPRPRLPLAAAVCGRGLRVSGAVGQARVAFAPLAFEGTLRCALDVVDGVAMGRSQREAGPRREAGSPPRGSSQ